MTVTNSTFVDRYPMFSELNTDVIDSELALSELFCPVDIWGDGILRDKAIGLLTAHELAIEYRDQLSMGLILRAIEEGGTINEEAFFGDDYYSLTIYGLKFLRLKNTLKGTAMFVV